MKKLFLVLAVATLGFVACNNDSDTKTEVKDSTVTHDTTVVAPVDTTVVVPVDTTVKADTTKK